MTDDINPVPNNTEGQPADSAAETPLSPSEAVEEVAAAAANETTTQTSTVSTATTEQAAASTAPAAAVTSGEAMGQMPASPNVAVGDQAPPPPPGAAQPQPQPQAPTQQMPYQTYDPQTQAPVAPGQQVAAAPGNGKALASLVCGICAIVFSWLPLLGIILGILAIVFASQYVKAFGKEGKATGGKITGIIGIAFAIIAMISYIFLGAIIGAAVNDSPSSRINSSSSYSSSSYSSTVDASKEDVYDAADSVIDKMCTFSESDYASYGDYLENDLLSYMSIGDKKITFADMGINKVDFAKQWLKPLSYSIDDISIYGTSATVYVDFEQTDELEFLSALSEKVMALTEESGYAAMSNEDALKRVGTLMNESLKQAGADEVSWSLSMNKSNSTWTASKTSYDSMSKMVLGYEYTAKATPSGVK